MEQRQKALLWWKTLNGTQKFSYSYHTFPGRKPSDLTGREIESIFTLVERYL